MKGFGKMKHFWMAVAVACLSFAAMALWRQNVDAAFVSATIGALAWFLNYRARMKELIDEKRLPDTESREYNESNEN